jgi:hypothetical protein
LLHPIFSNIRSALEAKLAASLTGVSAVSAADNAPACCTKRRTQFCPRWCGTPGAAAFQARLSIKRALTVVAITAMLKRMNGNAHSGNSDTVRRHA